MNQQMNISTFHSLLTADTEGDTLFDALRKLTEIKDPQEIAEAKSPQPLGSWAGWNFT